MCQSLLLLRHNVPYLRERLTTKDKYCPAKTSFLHLFGRLTGSVGGGWGTAVEAAGLAGWSSGCFVAGGVDRALLLVLPLLVRLAAGACGCIPSMRGCRQQNG